MAEWRNGTRNGIQNGGMAYGMAEWHEWRNGVQNGIQNGGMAYGMAYRMAEWHTEWQNGGMAYGMAGMARMQKRIVQKGIMPKGTSRALRKET